MAKKLKWHYGVRLLYTSFSQKNRLKIENECKACACQIQVVRAHARTRQAHAFSVKSSNQKKKIHEKRESPLNRLAISRCFFVSLIFHFPFDCVLSFHLKNAPSLSFIFARSRASSYQCWNSWGLRGVSW